MSEAPGVELVHQGAPPEAVCYLETGLCKLVRLQADGRRVIVGLRGAGRFVAAEAAILRRPSPVTAITLSTCQVSRLDSGRFRDLIRTNPELSWRLHNLQSEELYLETSRLADVGALSARQRLLQFLDRFHEGIPEDGESVAGVRFRVALKQWEIAQLIAVAPQYLSALIRQLEAEGLLRREGDAFVLRRRSSLRSPSRVARSPTKED